MSDYNYEQIKKIILEREQTNIFRGLKKQDQTEISKNNHEILIMDFTFQSCLAQLTVSNPSFAPYQYVSFEAMTFDSRKAQKSGNPELIYFFYDTSEMLIKEVIYELRIGIQYCSDYVPDLLIETYLNKQGIIDFGKEEPRKMVHPDDINKIGEITLYKNYQCIDMQAQYLVLNNTKFIVRVLPKAFVMAMCEKKHITL